MRKSLATLAAITVSACFIIAGITSLYSQTFTNPVTLLYLTSSTGQPVGVSPQNPLPVTIAGGGIALNGANNADGVAAVSTGLLPGTPSYNYSWNPVSSNWNRTIQADPCTGNAKTNLPISLQTTSITQQIALSGSTKIYVCSLSLIASAATVFSVTGGTGTNCGTPAALIGTTSATHGLSLAANGGMTLGNGAGTVAVTGAGSELCLVQSGAGDLVGNLTYVQQ